MGTHPYLLKPNHTGTIICAKQPFHFAGGSFGPASANILCHRAAGDLHLTNAAVVNELTLRRWAPLAASNVTISTIPAFQAETTTVQWGSVAGGQVAPQHLSQERPLNACYVSQTGLESQSNCLGRMDPSIGHDFMVDGDNLGLSFSQIAVEPAFVATPALEPHLAAHNNTSNIDNDNNNGFRYRATLHAPTAMAEAPGENPITYLNKSQPYLLSIEDRSLQVPVFHLPRYRTTIWVSFEDPERRANPEACWQLWKEVRGISQAQQAGSGLVAVEYLPAGKKINDGETQKAHSRPAWMELESQSHDGFSVLWGASTVTPKPECVISMRFNFVSTDFTRTKGVKGVPVRLCSRTEELPGTMTALSLCSSAEICYCIVKVFRDHGVARKIANDTLQVKRKIEKVKQNMEQPEGKRRSASEWRGSRYDLEEADDQTNLAILQNKLSSSRPVSILYLRGDDSDLPDFCHAFVQNVMESVHFHATSGFVTDSKKPFSQWPVHPVSSSPLGNAQVESLEIPQHQTVQNIAVDSERPSAAVAGFYIRTPSETYYRAIYLAQRTVDDLVRAITGKYNVDFAQVELVLHIDQKGRQIVVDDEVVRALPEGQDMIIEFVQQSDDDDTPTRDNPRQPSVPSLEITLKF
ncbi:hypothetical protein VTO42DRAFT_5168 [Malbranchea cinnamomea]